MRRISHILLLIGIACLLTLAFQRLFYSVANDFGTRYYGSRLLQYDAQLAYFNVPGKTVPAELANPYGRAGEVANGNTVTPFVLQIFSWLNGFSFTTAMQIWWAFSYLLLAAAVILIVYTFRKKIQSPVLLALPLLFIATAAWRMHLYSGQLYIFYTLLAAGIFFFVMHKKWALAGVVAALLVICRLPAVLLLLPLALLPEARKMIATFSISLAVFAAVSLLISGTEAWQYYFRAMGLYAQELQGGMPGLNVAGSTLQAATPFVAANGGYVADADIFSVQKLLVALHLPAGTAVLYTLYALVAGTGIFFLNRLGGTRVRDAKSLFLLGFALYILSEYFMPAPRYTYNFIQWLLPFAVIVYTNNGLNRLSSLLAVTGLCMNIFKLPFLPDAYSLGEILLLGALFLHLLPAYDRMVMLSPVKALFRARQTAV